MAPRKPKTGSKRGGEIENANGLRRNKHEHSLNRVNELLRKLYYNVCSTSAFSGKYNVYVYVYIYVYVAKRELPTIT